MCFTLGKEASVGPWTTTDIMEKIQNLKRLIKLSLTMFQEKQMDKEMSYKAGS